jgi:pimeloyl-ACP methyl ester carboxylesterase
MPSSIFQSHHESGKPVAAGHPRALVYFICGNPGLIDFYEDFLGILAQLIRVSPVSRAYDVYGRDLLGFSDDDHEPFSQQNLPWDLEGQIKGIYDDVAKRAKGGDYEFVVLMGHSVGAYIATEIMHRHMRDGGKTPELDLRHAVLLFPTLTHIALSPSGTRMSLLQRIPFLDANFHLLAGALVSCFPESAVRWVVETIMGFSPQAAAVVGRWLKSRDGVWQAVHLGKSELATIREDVWEEELWDVMQSSKDDADTAPPKFFLFYGKHDHWVANKLRDEFIDSRKHSSAKIVIDEGGIPHAFCTSESEFLPA